jgi:hypothetical protein
LQPDDTRIIPIPPVLVRLLRAHIKGFGTAPDGRTFQTAWGGHASGERIRRSDLATAERTNKIFGPRLAGILDLLGLLNDDRLPALDTWITTTTRGLTPGIRDDVHHWLTVLREARPATGQRAPRPCTTTCAMPCPPSPPGPAATSTSARSPAVTSPRSQTRSTAMRASAP